MLVLSRKKNESVVIGNDITIYVVEIRGDKVRLGIDAPKSVSVHRLEVYEAIQRDGQKKKALNVQGIESGRTRAGAVTTDEAMER
jgi:carbon storage regulator